MAIHTRLIFLFSFFFATVLSTSIAIDRTGWTATADSFQPGNEPAKAIDGNANNFWHSQYKPSIDPIPNWIIIDMKKTYNIHALSYLPRQDGRTNGRITGHKIEVSLDGTNWGDPVALGTWFNDMLMKKTTFLTRPARYVKFTALSEATGTQLTSAAEINIFHDVKYLDRTGWTVSADSENVKSANTAAKANDGDEGTFWHTQYSGTTTPYPHWYKIDAGVPITVAGLAVMPRADRPNGRIGSYNVETSNDGTTWTKVATGVWPDDANEKVAGFTTTARYFRLNALSEAGNRGQFTSAGEINLVGSDSAPYTAPVVGRGLWQNTVDFPLVPAAAAVLPNGKLLLWSAHARDDYGGSNGFTQTAIYDPVTGDSTPRTVTNTQHDMFCPGISMDFDGRILISGGSDAAKFTIYDSTTNGFIGGPNMKIPRGYQSTATTSDGRIFNIGGSWSGGKGNKNGEIYDVAANAWSLIKNGFVAPMLTADTGGVWRADNHAWLFGWKNSFVFQAGPSKQMNWYDTVGDGSVTAAGLRADDGDSMCGNAVMYDATAGKILTAGGAPSYAASTAHTNAYVITIGDPKTNPDVVRVPDMMYPRGFANGVALPDGTVFVTGGQTAVNPFTDTTAKLVPELYDPQSNTWTQLNPMAIPRTYHSVALLLPDATVFQGGGGLCGTCGVNHLDAEIFVPPYLLNSDGSRRTRPQITSAPTTVKLGESMDINTDSFLNTFSLVRMGTATHTVNTDQRRIPLAPAGIGPTYTVTIPTDPGVALPGYWYLFAIDMFGTPSVAKIIKVTP